MGQKHATPIICSELLKIAFEVISAVDARVIIRQDFPERYDQLILDQFKGMLLVLIFRPPCVGSFLFCNELLYLLF